MDNAESWDESAALKQHSAMLESEAGGLFDELRSLSHDPPPASVLRTLRYGRKWALPRPAHHHPFPSAGCRSLDHDFVVASEPESTSEGGVVTSYSRADLPDRTLEVGAATGEFGGRRFPSTDTFILGLNRASASIGAAVRLPAHGPGALLEVEARLQIYHWPGKEWMTPGAAGPLLFVVPGATDLPLRGAAAAWCRAGLTIWGTAGARSRVTTEFVSGWVNRDGSEHEDGAPDGVIRLSHTVLVNPDLVVAGVFIDATCFAAAEESATRFESAFASFQCRDGSEPPAPSSYLRLEQLDVRLCELPVLASPG